MTHPTNTLNNRQYYAKVLAPVIGHRCTSVIYEAVDHYGVSELWVGLEFDNGEQVWFYADEEGNAPGVPMLTNLSDYKPDVDTRFGQEVV
jgi:hypothetical protein